MVLMVFILVQLSNIIEVLGFLFQQLTIFGFLTHYLGILESFASLDQAKKS